jgi:16S rRNA (guanine527-N7)-methyltransferase
MMDRVQLASLLQPFLAGPRPSPELLERLHLYLDLLLRWNARMNLTAVRDPEQIVTRHFGESLFAAQVLRRHVENPKSLADVGSGAGFPGIPIKLLAPDIQLTLIESQNKKATFLREVVRALKLENANVFCGRAEEWNALANVVTLRAVEKFERALPVAAGLVEERGSLCLLIGADQLPSAQQHLGSGWRWFEPVAVPASTARKICLAQRTV